MLADKSNTHLSWLGEEVFQQILQTSKSESFNCNKTFHFSQTVLSYSRMFVKPCCQICDFTNFSTVITETVSSDLTEGSSCTRKGMWKNEHLKAFSPLRKDESLYTCIKWTSHPRSDRIQASFGILSENSYKIQLTEKKLQNKSLSF